MKMVLDNKMFNLICLQLILKNKHFPVKKFTQCNVFEQRLLAKVKSYWFPQITDNVLSPKDLHHIQEVSFFLYILAWKSKCQRLTHIQLEGKMKSLDGHPLTVELSN